MKVKSLSRVRLLAAPWTAAYQAPLSMGFSRQEYWSGVPLPSPRPRLGVLKVFPVGVTPNIGCEEGGEGHGILGCVIGKDGRQVTGHVSKPGKRSEGQNYRA